MQIAPQMCPICTAIQSWVLSALRTFRMRLPYVRGPHIGSTEDDEYTCLSPPPCVIRSAFLSLYSEPLLFTLIGTRCFESLLPPNPHKIIAPTHNFIWLTPIPWDISRAVN